MPAEFPVLLTSRLVLREMHENDTAGYQALLTDAEEARFITDTLRSPEEIPAKLRSNREAFALDRAVYWSLSHDGSFVGFVALHNPSSPVPWLSYAISKRWRRRGLATEAVTTVLEYAFAERCASSVFASTHVDNDASARLLRSLGFYDEGLVETEKGFRRRFRRGRPLETSGRG